MPEKEPRLSVVVPLLNEEPNVGPLCERLWGTLDGIGEPFEVIAVDDGSTDGTLDRLLEESERRPELVVIELARNFGQHAAVMAGFDAARGEWIVTLDADLQNPPEEIASVVAALRRGHDLVHTYRKQRHDGLFRRLASRSVAWLSRRLSGIELRDLGCMLRGYSREVARAIARRGGYRTFIPALASAYARNPTEIPVAHEARHAGKSRYSLARLFALELDLMTSFSLAPLRLLFLCGLAVCALGVAFGALLLALRLIYGAEWAEGGVFTLFAVLFFFVGAQFIAFGLIGEYVGRILQEVRRRPTYLVRAVHTARSGGRRAREAVRQATSEAGAEGEPWRQPRLLS